MSDGFSLALQKAVRVALLTDSGVTDLISTRLYDEPPANAVYPYARFGNIVADTLDTDGSTSADVAMTIIAHSRSTGRVEASRIAEAIRAALHRQESAVTPAGFSLVELICEQYYADRDDAAGRGYTATIMFSALMETA
jgi:hypothetical protein